MKENYYFSNEYSMDDGKRTNEITLEHPFGFENIRSGHTVCYNNMEYGDRIFN